MPPGERFSHETSIAHFLIGIGSEDTDEASGRIEVNEKASDLLTELSTVELETSSVSWKDGSPPAVLNEIFLFEVSAVVFGTE